MQLLVASAVSTAYMYNPAAQLKTAHLTIHVYSKTELVFSRQKIKGKNLHRPPTICCLKFRTFVDPEKSRRQKLLPNLISAV